MLNLEAKTREEENHSALGPKDGQGKEVKLLDADGNVRNKIKMGTIPKSSCNRRRGSRKWSPFSFYPSQATQSSIAVLAISPRKTDSVRI